MHVAALSPVWTWGLPSAAVDDVARCPQYWLGVAASCVGVVSTARALANCVLAVCKRCVAVMPAIRLCLSWLCAACHTRFRGLFWTCRSSSWDAICVVSFVYVICGVRLSLLVRFTRCMRCTVLLPAGVLCILPMTSCGCVFLYVAGS